MRELKIDGFYPQMLEEPVQIDGGTLGEDQKTYYRIATCSVHDLIHCELCN